MSQKVVRDFGKISNLILYQKSLPFSGICTFNKLTTIFANYTISQLYLVYASLLLDSEKHKQYHI